MAAPRYLLVTAGDLSLLFYSSGVVGAQFSLFRMLYARCSVFEKRILVVVQEILLQGGNLRSQVGDNQ